MNTNTQRIELKTIGELLDGFTYDKSEARGLNGMNGRLIIQPELQRAYLSEGARENKIIDSLLNNIPIGAIIIAQKDDDVTYQVIDGQQRLTAIGRWLTGEFGYDSGKGASKLFSQYTKAEQEEIRALTIPTYICHGDSAYIATLFERVNTTAIILNSMEIKCGVYSGPFLTGLKKTYSVSKDDILHSWMGGDYKRQAYLYKALLWTAKAWDKDGNYDLDKLDKYLDAHKLKSDISEVNNFVDSAIDWADKYFSIDNSTPVYADDINWGRLYDIYAAMPRDNDWLKTRIDELKNDDYISDSKNIIEYALYESTLKKGCKPDANMIRLLNVRLFNTTIANMQYKKQTDAAHKTGESNCPLCAMGHKTTIYKLGQMDADHVTAWSKGGTTDASNCVMLCKTHNRAKGNK